MASLAEQYYTASQKAYAENLARYQEARGIIEKLITSYAPETYYGATGAGKVQKELLEEAKTRDVAGIKAGYYGAGLGGTTMAYNVPMAWERQVGAPARAKLEDVRTSRQEEYKMALQNLVVGIQTPYPDYSALMQASAARASVPSAPTYAQTLFRQPTIPSYQTPDVSQGVSGAGTLAPYGLSGGYRPTTTTTPSPLVWSGPGMTSSYMWGPQTTTPSTTPSTTPATTPTSSWQNVYTSMPLTYGQWQAKNPKGTQSQYLAYYNALKK